MTKQYFQTGGVDTYTNPLLNDGQLIHGVNVISFPYGAKAKRAGYTDYLNVPDTSPVKRLWQFQKNNGTQFFNYRASGSSIYYSTQGTGNWTICGNGTIANGAYVDYAFLADTMIIGDGIGSTRHTTNGTSFTDTVLAPVAPYFEQYQNRIYAAGTASTLFYSSANDPTNWNTAGTSDSSSFQIPGGGKLSKPFKVADRLIAPKNNRLMFRWDGYSLVDMATTYGPSSPFSVGEAEGYRFYVNQYGNYGFGGGNPELLSNAIQRQFYSNTGLAINGTVFPTIPGVAWRYDYLASVGSVTDNFTNRTMNNCIINYNFQKNEYLNWSFANKPTAFMSALDIDGNTNMYFGDTDGNTFIMDPEFTGDQNAAITSEMVFVYTASTVLKKNWRFLRGVFNPGCQAKMQIATSDFYTYSRLKWQEIGDFTDGVAEYRFPPGSQSRFLFIRIYESSSDPAFVYYGLELDFDVLSV